jgi:D-beta-D-heptose 7-phosphate kinase/D-beta-D-heptose 1-phosphate adenosyltransferase
VRQSNRDAAYSLKLIKTMVTKRKIQSRRALKGIVAELQRKKKTVVFTNGCFDLLHIGHVELFKKAKSFGDVLVVAINSDASLKRLKGPSRPLVGEKERSQVLAAIEYIDFVTVFGEDTPEEIIKALRPDILVKGADYRLDQIVGRQYVKAVKRFPLVKGHSTSALIKKIIANYKLPITN